MTPNIAAYRETHILTRITAMRERNLKLRLMIAELSKGNDPACLHSLPRLEKELAYNTQRLSEDISAVEPHINALPDKLRDAATLRYIKGLHISGVAGKLYFSCRHFYRLDKEIRDLIPPAPPAATAATENQKGGTEQ